MVDMAHFAGLVAAGEHPNPVQHADVVTTTIHKTLCGPRSGMILCREEHAKAIDKAIFPGQQGGPLMHTIAAKAVALRIAASEQFRARQRQTIANAQAFAAGLEAGGVPVLTGGTDVHLVLVDLTPTGLDGQTAEDRLEEVGITVNRNAIPFDERPPMNPSGLRIGTPALTTRGLVEDDMREIAAVIATALSDDFESEKDALAERDAGALMDRYPLYPQLSRPSLTVRERIVRGRHRRRDAEDPHMRVWVDCTAAAHPLVLRPIIERLRSARARGLRHRARVRADAGDPRPARDPVHRRSAATAAPRRSARRGRSAGRSARLARLVWERRPDLAIAHGSVDLAVVSALFRIPSAQMQDYEFAGLQRRIAFRVARRVLVPDAIPLERLARIGAKGEQAGPLPGPQGGVLPGRLRARPGGARRARARPREGPGRRPAAAGDLRVPRPQRPLRRDDPPPGGASPRRRRWSSPAPRRRAPRRGRSAPPT